MDYTNGYIEQVTEEDIAAAKSFIGKDGVGSEPASAATVAGCKKMRDKGVMKKDEEVVCILTGHLLKDPDYTVEFHTDNLFLDAKRETSVTGKKRIPTGEYSNRPVKMKADTDEILEFIYKRDNSKV